MCHDRTLSKAKNNSNGSHVVPCFVALTINSTVFHQLNNHIINFSSLNGNVINVIKTENLIFMGSEKTEKYLLT